MIEYVSFHSPVKLGSDESTFYSMTKHGRDYDVQQEGNFLVFTSKKDPQYRRRVPLTNVGDIGERIVLRVDAKPAEKNK